MGSDDRHLFLSRADARMHTPHLPSVGEGSICHPHHFCCGQRGIRKQDKVLRWFAANQQCRQCCAKQQGWPCESPFHSFFECFRLLLKTELELGVIVETHGNVTSRGDLYGSLLSLGSIALQIS